MARGEADEREGRAGGLAIWAVFGVACLATALLVVWATSEPEEPPSTDPFEEPFTGAEATLRQLGWRGCGETGPAVPTAPHAIPLRERAEQRLEARGYVTVEGAEWGEPEGLPLARTFPALEGACGVVAVIAEPGALISRVGPRGTRPCQATSALVASCGEPIEVEGSGLVSARAFVLPGLTPSAAEATGVPVEALLAHAEAEHLLARAGWLGSDTVLEESVPRSALASRVMPSPPTPDAGCVPWVVVGLGVGDARTSWMGRQVDHDPTEGHFALGVIACAPGSLGSRITELRSHQGAGAATLYMRAFEPRQGPAVQEGPPLARVGELRLVSDAEELSEVRSVEDRGED